MDYEEYKPAIRLGGSLAPSGSGTFPIARACDILMPDETRLDEFLSGSTGGSSTEWQIIDKPSLSGLPTSITDAIKVLFRSNGTAYTGIYCSGAIYYVKEDGTRQIVYAKIGWTNTAYKNIIINGKISDLRLFAWLKANATLLSGEAISPYQPAYDETLLTENKTVSGAINEILTYGGNSGTSAEMPIIRFCSARGNKGSDLGVPVTLRIDSGIYLTFEIVGGGALQLGDALQLCRMKTYYYGKNDDFTKYKKQKLRRFTEYIITEDDLDKKYLTIPINLSGEDAMKIEQALCHNGRMDEHRVSPIYARIRRPKGELQNNESGMSIDADFSNIVRITRKYSRYKMLFE
jgi:hypothetical protein